MAHRTFSFSLSSHSARAISSPLFHALVIQRSLVGCVHDVKIWRQTLDFDGGHQNDLKMPIFSHKWVILSYFSHFWFARWSHCDYMVLYDHLGGENWLERGLRLFAIFGLYYEGKHPNPLIKMMQKNLKKQMEVITLEIGHPWSKNSYLKSNLTLNVKIWRMT